MEIIYEWIWENGSLGCVPEVDGNKDYVVVVNWRIRGTYNRGGLPAITSDAYGQTALPVVEGSDFVPFEELTSDIIIGWLEPIIDIPAEEAKIAQQIENILSPPIIYPSIPWASETNV